MGIRRRLANATPATLLMFILRQPGWIGKAGDDAASATPVLTGQ
jgi:hypothetical protein